MINVSMLHLSTNAAFYSLNIRLNDQIVEILWLNLLQTPRQGQCLSHQRRYCNRFLPCSRKGHRTIKGNLVVEPVASLFLVSPRMREGTLTE